MINEKYVKKFCKEDLSKIENYDKAIADTTKMWHCHHRTEIWWNCSKKDLIENECYYNRKACELIFLTPAEHNKLHKKGKPRSEDTRIKIGNAHKYKVVSEETRRKQSISHKGQVPWNKGKKCKNISEETRRKISESMKKYLAKKRGEI